MRSRHSIAPVALAALLALWALGCGDDGDDDDGENGGGAAAGNVGGTGGAATGVGGAAFGGSGGGTQSGGAAATGGSGSTLESRIFTACDNWHRNAQVLGCMGSYSDAYVASCQAELNQAAQTCAAEVEALLDCGTMLTALEYQCDANDNIAFAPGVCAAEQSALDQCQQ
jgi:hypothetical protein